MGEYPHISPQSDPCFPLPSKFVLFRISWKVCMFLIHLASLVAYPDKPLWFYRHGEYEMLSISKAYI